MENLLKISLNLKCSLKRGAGKFHKLIRIHLLESIFGSEAFSEKGAGKFCKLRSIYLHRSPFLAKQRLQHWCLPLNLTKFFKKPSLQNFSGDCFWALKETYLKITIHELNHISQIYIGRSSNLIFKIRLCWLV